MLSRLFSQRSLLGPLLASAAVLASASSAVADPINWQSVQISTLGSTGYAVSFASLPDGRCVLGQQGSLYVQNTFGATAKTPFPANSVTFDPSFVAIKDGTHGLLGAGGSFGAVSGLHPFDPTNATAGTGGVRPALATTAQSYVAAYWKVGALEGWIVGGANGPSGPFSGHNLIFVSLDGTKSGPISEELCTYSAGVATDASGNVFAALYELPGSPNEGNVDKVVRFTSAQVTAKVQAIMDGSPATPLSLSEATFVHKFNSASSIAVDASGQVWAAGFNMAHLQVFNPATGALRVVSPVHDLINGGSDTYQVATFTRSGVPSIGVLAYDGWTFSDTPVYYVTAPISEVTMPTDTTYLTWRASKFGQNALVMSNEVTQWGVNADPDADGFTNLTEYALDLAPLASNGSSPIVEGKSGELLTLTFPRNPAAKDLVYTVEVSETLMSGSWTAIASSSGGAATIPTGTATSNELTQGTLKLVTVTDETTAAGVAPRFMRLRISLNNP